MKKNRFLKISETMELEIQFRGAIVGFVRNVATDMWYMDGDWVPSSSASSAPFLAFLQTANLRRNVIAGTGKLVKWREVGMKEWQNGHGLALGVKDGRLMLRMLQPETEQQLAENGDNGYGT